MRFGKCFASRREEKNLIFIRSACAAVIAAAFAMALAAWLAGLVFNKKKSCGACGGSGSAPAILKRDLLELAPVLRSLAAP